MCDTINPNDGFYQISICAYEIEHECPHKFIHKCVELQKLYGKYSNEIVEFDLSHKKDINSKTMKKYEILARFIEEGYCSITESNYWCFYNDDRLFEELEKRQLRRMQ